MPLICRYKAVTRSLPMLGHNSYCHRDKQHYIHNHLSLRQLLPFCDDWSDSGQKKWRMRGGAVGRRRQIGEQRPTKNIFNRRVAGIILLALYLPLLTSFRTFDLQPATLSNWDSSCGVPSTNNQAPTRVFRALTCDTAVSHRPTVTLHAWRLALHFRQFAKKNCVGSAVVVGDYNLPEWVANLLKFR